MPNTTTPVASDRIADDIERMLDLLETAIRPMGSHGTGPHGGASCGLFGGIYTMEDSEARAEEFRQKLAELMIEYNVDRVDVSWSVPQVVKRFARNRAGDTPPPPEPVGA